MKKQKFKNIDLWLCFSVLVAFCASVGIPIIDGCLQEKESEKQRKAKECENKFRHDVERPFYADVNSIWHHVFDSVAALDLAKVNWSEPVQDTNAFKQYDSENIVVGNDTVFYPEDAKYEIKYKYIIAEKPDWKDGWDKSVIRRVQFYDRKIDVGYTEWIDEAIARVEKREYVEPAFKKAVQTRDSLKNIIEKYNKAKSISDDVWWNNTVNARKTANTATKCLEQNFEKAKKVSYSVAKAYAQKVHMNCIRNNYRIRNNCSK